MSESDSNGVGEAKSRGGDGDRPLRIAMLAPPWIAVPPPGYGGIETVVAMISNALVARGHALTLFAAPGSQAAADVHSPLDDPHPDSIEHALYEVDHVARSFAEVDAAAAAGEPFDIVHDHCGFSALAFADRLSTPLVHTLHGPFTPETSAFYGQHGAKGWIVAISQTQLDQGPAGMRVAGVVSNPIDVREWPPPERKSDYLLWIGRMTEDKGPHRAIVAARRAERPVVLAGPVQPGKEEFFANEVEPHIDGDAVRYVGEVGGEEKQKLFAEAAGMLMPIDWPEPFGMVMVEAMVCGTPVISFPKGAATEIVRNGETGFLVGDEQEMAEAVGRLEEIDAERCREDTIARYDVDHVSGRYEEVYRRVVAAAAEDGSGGVEAPRAEASRAGR